jgi:hypothetical protein
MRAPPTSTHVLDVAVVEIDQTGAGTLHLGVEFAEHIAAAHPGQLARVILDYAATAGRDLTVVTRHRDGDSTVHQIHPVGTITPVPQASKAPHAANPGPQARSRRPAPRRWTVGAVRSLARSVGRTSTAWRGWFGRHGLWLMLCVQIIALMGSLAFIAFVPHL